MIQRIERDPLEEFVERVKKATQGNNASHDIQNAVAALLKSYGIETPVKK